MLRQDFDGHIASQARIAGAIHLAHPARAQRRRDLIRPEFCACADQLPCLTFLLAADLCAAVACPERAAGESYGCPLWFAFSWQLTAWSLLLARRGLSHFPLNGHYLLPTMGGRGAKGRDKNS